MEAEPEAGLSNKRIQVRANIPLFKDSKRTDFFFICFSRIIL